jgi:hypothetical protein
MKPHSPPTFRKWLICLSIVVVVVSAIGLAVNAKGFFENLLSEGAGIFVGIIVALLIVDKYTEHQKEQQWARVRDLTYQALAAHLCGLTTDALIRFPIGDHRPMTPIVVGRDHPNPATVPAIGDLLSQLRKLPSAVSAEKSTSDLSVEFYEMVKWDLDQIRDVLTPRVVQSSNDQQIIDALIEFDDAGRRLHNAIIVHKRIVTHSVFPDTMALLEQVQSLYGILCDKWN